MIDRRDFTAARGGWLWLAGGTVIGLGLALGAGLRAIARRGAGSGAPLPYIRSAGPLEQRDEDGSDWDAVDEASDESFPASDPPARY